MDSSIKLEGNDLTPVQYVLGITPKVPAYKLDMVEVFEGVIKKLKPQLKYLPCFEPLSGLLNGGILTGCATRRTNITLVGFPEGKSERTKGVEIQVLEEGDVETISTRKSLILTEDGELLIWSAVYDRPIGSDRLCREFTRGRDEVARESRFEIFNREKLENALSQGFAWKVDWRKVIFKILEFLFGEINKCMEERENYLQNMKYARDGLGVVLNRIQPPR